MVPGPISPRSMCGILLHREPFTLKKKCTATTLHNDNLLSRLNSPLEILHRDATSYVGHLKGVNTACGMCWSYLMVLHGREDGGPGICNIFEEPENRGNIQHFLSQDQLTTLNEFRITQGAKGINDG